MYICYCPLRDPNWNKILYCIVLYCYSNYTPITSLGNKQKNTRGKKTIPKRTIFEVEKKQKNQFMSNK